LNTATLAQLDRPAGRLECSLLETNKSAPSLLVARGKLRMATPPSNASPAALSEQAQVQRVAAAELRSLKPGRAVYLKRQQVFFLCPREAALEHVAAKAQST
jgi:hypothetical protein